ncbi:MAG TPA: FtsX-like permease family protein, partial [Acidimicrobiia bacterium]|nr:FtsX-like permease family protein [Acidimicrobiia bacterium]
MFGVPIGTLAIVLIAVVGLGIGILATLAIRNVVFFRLGMRNAARRRGRSVLIVVGLMLATTIIASALGTGDTMGRTIRSSVLRTLGRSDEWITVRAAKQSPIFQLTGSTGNDLFDERVLADVDHALSGSGLVDGVAPAIIDTVAVQDVTSRHTEPRVGVFAADPARLSGFGTIVGSSGRPVSLADLTPGAVYLDRRAADKLHARAGDTVVALAGSHLAKVRVADIVDYRGTGTDGPSILMPLAAAQRALGAEGKVRQILVSNRGGEAGGVALTDAVTRRLGPVLAAHGLEARPVKRDGLQQADDTGKSFMQIFSTFGSFSVAAGILLIFLIFVMLAAERRTEMGVARAIGTRRGHLVETFLFEGTVYDVAAAALGALLGVGVSFAMVTGVGRAFAQSAPSLDIVYSVRWQSLAVAYTIGVLLTLVIVALSAWRVSVVNIVTAIRNLPDPRRRPRRRRSILTGSLVVLLGALFAVSGRSGQQAMPFMLGVSLVIVGLVPLLRILRVPDRVSYTFGGLGIVVLWLLPFRTIEQLVPGAQMDFTLWVVGGLLIVVGATWTVIYNADVLLGFGMWAFGRIRALTSVLRISMAYPLRTRLRTGMTLAMFTIVVFNLVVGATTTNSFLHAFTQVDRYSGGFD